MKISISEIARNNRKIITVFCVIFAIGLLQAARYYIDENHIPSILSLKDHWNDLETSAHSWQADAYPINISVNVLGQRHYPIEAEYLSQTSPNKILLVAVDSSGKIIQFSHPATSPTDSTIESQLKFDKQSWKIDSQEAINIFAESKEVRSCLTKSSGAEIHLALSRSLTENVVWQLWIINCPGKDPGPYYVDALTGELFN